MKKELQFMGTKTAKKTEILEFMVEMYINYWDICKDGFADDTVSEFNRGMLAGYANNVARYLKIDSIQVMRILRKDEYSFERKIELLTTCAEVSKSKQY